MVKRTTKSARTTTKSTKSTKSKATEEPKKKSTKAKWVDLDIEGVKADVERIASETPAGFVNFYKWKDENEFRFLPPWDANVDSVFRAKFAREIWLHWGVPPDAPKKDQKSVVCVGKTIYNHPPKCDCYTCGLRQQMFDSGNPDNIKIAKDMKASRSFLSNIIDVNDPFNDDGSVKVQVVKYGVRVYKALTALLWDDEYGNFTHPETGFNIKVSVTNPGEQDANYQVRPSRRESSLEDFLPDKSGVDPDEAFDALVDLENIGDVSDWYKELTFEEHEDRYAISEFSLASTPDRLLESEEEDEEEEFDLVDDEEEDEGDDDDEEEDEYDDDEEEEEEEEDDDEEEEEDDDEEEALPPEEEAIASTLSKSVRGRKASKTRRTRK